MQSASHWVAFLGIVLSGTTSLHPGVWLGTGGLRTGARKPCDGLHPSGERDVEIRRKWDKLRRYVPPSPRRTLSFSFSFRPAKVGKQETPWSRIYLYLLMRFDITCMICSVMHINQTFQAFCFIIVDHYNIHSSSFAVNILICTPYSSSSYITARLEEKWPRTWKLFNSFHCWESYRKICPHNQYSFSIQNYKFAQKCLIMVPVYKCQSRNNENSIHVYAVTRISCQSDV